MSSSETEISSSSSESGNDDPSEDDEYCSISSVFEPYRFELLARTDQEQADININETDDEDGLTQRIINSRYDGDVPLNQWYLGSYCKSSHLEEAKECRCCREVGPVQATLSFDGSVERISCITEHEGYKALTHEVVLKQMGPLLRDSSGKSYKRRGSRGEKQYLRAVAYRITVRWLCGSVGWEKRRPLPACVYNDIRNRYFTKRMRGYATSSRDPE